MKKNILIGVLIVISILSIVFGYTQKIEADRQRAVMKEHMKMLEAARADAEVFKREAETNLREAVRQEQISQNLLKKHK